MRNIRVMAAVLTVTIAASCDQGNVGASEPSGNAVASIEIDCGETVLTYTGGQSGDLGIRAPYGELSLPAVKYESTSDAGGRTVTVTTIRASGTGGARIAKRADLEACVASGLSGQGLTLEAADDDMKFYFANQCHQKLPLESEASPVNATAEAIVIGGPDAQVFIERNYAGAPDYLKSPTFPILQCSVQGA